MFARDAFQRLIFLHIHHKILQKQLQGRRSISLSEGALKIGRDPIWA